MKKLSLKLMTALMVLCFAVAISGCDQNTCGMSDKGCTAASCKCGKCPDKCGPDCKCKTTKAKACAPGCQKVCCKQA